MRPPLSPTPAPSRRGRVTTALLLAALFLATAAPARGQEPPTADADPDRDDLLDHPIGFAKALVGDGWATVVAPFQLEGRAAGTAGLAVWTGLVLFARDEPVHEAVVDASESGLGHRIERIGTALDPVALMGTSNKYWLAGMLISELAGQERLELIFKEILFSHWIAGAGRKLVGRTIGRQRPEAGKGAYAFEFWNGSSFPSGHASTITQVAAILSHHIDRWPVTVLLYGLAGTVVWERVSTDAHWPSDAWLGAAWGWGVAQVVMRRREGSAGMGPWGAVPIVDPATGSVGFRIPLGPDPGPR